MAVEPANKRQKLQQWDPENMLSALNTLEQAYKENYGHLNRKSAIGSLDVKRVAFRNRVPRTTLRDRFIEGKGRYQHGLGCPSTLTEDQEQRLVSIIIDRQQNAFPFTILEVRQLVFRYCVVNKISHKFNKRNKVASWDWWSAFKKRHPQISARTPENLSRNRALGMERNRITSYFDKLYTLYQKYDVLDKPHLIYNVDETGLQTTPSSSKRRKVLAKRGSKLVQQLTTAERGTTTTCVACLSASGHYIPPLIIVKNGLLPAVNQRDLPRGTIVKGSKSGWVDKGLFKIWFEHFVKHLPPVSHNKKVVLFFDNHSSHTQPEIMLLADKHNIALIPLPSHTSNNLQPCDVSFFGPLKNSWVQRCRGFMNNNPGKVIQMEDFGLIFTNTWTAACTNDNAASSFRKAGLHPLNFNAIDNQTFVIADALLGQNTSASHSIDFQHNDIENQPTTSYSADVQHEHNPLPSYSAADNIQPSCSFMVNFPAGELEDSMDEYGTVIGNNGNTYTELASARHLGTSTPVDSLMPDNVAIHNATPSSHGSTSTQGVSTDFVDLIPPLHQNMELAKRAVARMRSPKVPLNPTPERNHATTSSKKVRRDWIFPVCHGSFNNDISGEDWYTCMECGEWCHKACGRRTLGMFVCLGCRPSVIARLQL